MNQNISNENLRPYLLMRKMSPLSGAIHFTFIFVFYFFGAPVLAAFNVLSVLMWAAVYFVNEKGHVVAGAWIGSAELLGFCSLAVLTLGTESGFQFYLFVLMVAPFMVLAADRIVLSLSIIVVAVMVFTVLSLVGQHPAFAVSLPAATLKLFYSANILNEALLLAFSGYYFSRAVRVAECERDREHKKAERLLHNVLPAAVAEQLKDDSHSFVDKYDNVTVFFCDIVGFTKLSSRTTPEELVGLLNLIFSEFDDLAEKHGLEKIKTIGDAYMAVAGVPDPVERHAESVANFALDVIDTIEQLNHEHSNELSVRVGINSGTVVAGIIGRKKFSYDLWGDCVNTASRMESHGIAGKIQTTKETYDLLKHSHLLDKRGTIEVKGKGELETYLLLGRSTIAQDQSPGV